MSDDDQVKVDVLSSCASFIASGIRDDLLPRILTLR